jgi:hypothetical protein
MISKPGARVFPLKEWEWGENSSFEKNKDALEADLSQFYGA